MTITRYLPLLLVLTCAIVVSAQEQQAPERKLNLMPVPASVKLQNERLAVDAGFKVATRGHTDARLQAGIWRFIKRLEGRTVLTLSPTLALDDQMTQFIVNCQGPGKNIPSVSEDESYHIDITRRQAILGAPTVVGALRGLETMLQLLDADRNGYFFPGVQIDDRPRFPWRGLMIDSARHFQTMDVLKRNLDGMAALKMNVFHWHLSEDQGFRVESKKFPKLHQLGSDGNYYTQEQVKEIIAYARDRGIRVYPEFDIPGHSTSWLVGYPELGSAPGPYTIERRPGIFEPALDPTREEVYKFLEGFLGEMAALFPDEYLHIGGDENEGKQWDRNPAIQAYMKQKGIKDNHALQAYFNTRLLKILQKHNKKMIGWDEIQSPDLPKNILIQSWRGPKALADNARNGYDGILSNGYYLDLLFPVADHYLNDPVPADSTLTAEERKHILGGEACMWSEFVSPETIDSRIWPRMAAIAERLWSPGEVRDLPDMYRRLEIESVRLDGLGMKHLSSYEPMLARLTGGKPTASLRVLADLVTPVKQYRRGTLRVYTSSSVLDRLVDTARPDSVAMRTFQNELDKYLLSPPDARNDAALRTIFTTWRDNHAVLEPVLTASTLGQEARPLSRDLAALGTVGLEALDAFRGGRQSPADWTARARGVVEAAAPARAEVELFPVRGMAKLVLAASQLDQLKSMTPADWSRRLDEQLKASMGSRSEH